MAQRNSWADLRNEDIALLRQARGVPVGDLNKNSAYMNLTPDDVQYIARLRGREYNPKFSATNNLRGDDVDFLRNLKPSNQPILSQQFTDSGSPYAGGPYWSEQKFKDQGTPDVGDPFAKQFQENGSPYAGGPYWTIKQFENSGSPYVGGLPSGDTRTMENGIGALAPTMNSKSQKPGGYQLSPANGGGAIPNAPMPPQRPTDQGQLYYMDDGNGGMLRQFMSKDGQMPNIPGMNAVSMGPQNTDVGALTKLLRGAF